MHQFVIHELGPLLYDQRVSEADLRTPGRRAAAPGARRRSGSPSPAPSARALVQSVTDDVLGYGPIDPLLRDPTITEVMVNGPDHVYVERSGKLVLTDVKFVDETHLRRIIDKIVSQVGRRVDEANPMVDARLPDGSRVNVIVHPLSIGGPFMTIRKFAADPYTGRRPHQLRHVHAAGRALHQPVRARPPERRGERRYRYREDDDAQRALELHPDRRAHRHRRGRQGAPAPADARAPAARRARRTSRARARSRSATSSATRCVCGPTASSSVRSVAARRSTCSRP